MRNTPWFKRKSSRIVLGLISLAVVLFTFMAAAPFHSTDESGKEGSIPG